MYCSNRLQGTRDAKYRMCKLHFRQPSRPSRHRICSWRAAWLLKHASSRVHEILFMLQNVRFATAGRQCILKPSKIDRVSFAV